MTQDRIELVIIGDIHGAWDEADTAYLNAARCDAVLFVGDLGTWGRLSAVPVAQRLAPLAKQSFLVLGNHDATSLGQLAREVTGLPGIRTLDARGQKGRVDKIRRALGANVALVGYSAHALVGPNGFEVGLIVGRPHAMGGTLSFAPYIAAEYGVHDLAESATRLCELVDACPQDDIVFLAHNGPTGLGVQPTDIWGCDFRQGGGDWGDPDLRSAIDHALERGRRVRAVVAGHMHLKTKQKRERAWHLERDGLHYINAARVPRHHKDGARHHVALTLTPEHTEVREVWVGAE